MSDLVGSVIAGRYRVEAFLGKGGMADVYRVWDEKRSVDLALKMLHADLAEDKIFLRRFRREAQTLARLQHPHIVRFYSLEQDGDLVFILMDYVEGTTLRKEIFQTSIPFPFERVMQVMRPVCAALRYAHESGYVHCDIKPANIMISRSGTVLVSDFGIARMSEASTSTLIGAGTPAYMAPEQARGEDPSPQTDIYALGVVLYEMLTGGERPFTGENARTTGSTSEKIRWEQINREPPSPRLVNPDISPEREAILLRCLNKDPAIRFRSCLELITALQQTIAAPVMVVEQAVVPEAPVQTPTTPAAHVEEPPVAAQEEAAAEAPAEAAPAEVAISEEPAAPLEREDAAPAELPAQPEVPAPGEEAERPEPAAGKPARRAPIGLFILIILGLIAGVIYLDSRSGSQSPIAAFGPASTPTPTFTPWPSPTPWPTNTPVPLPMGEVVQGNGLQFVVLDVFRHTNVYTGDNYYHYANPGYMLVDIYARLENLGSQPLDLDWSDLTVVDDAGTTWVPAYAGMQLVAQGERVDPFDIRTDITVERTPSFQVKKIAFLRLYYTLVDKAEQVVLFSVGDSPAVEVTVKK